MSDGWPLAGALLAAETSASFVRMRERTRRAKADNTLVFDT